MFSQALALSFCDEFWLTKNVNEFQCDQMEEINTHFLLLRNIFAIVITTVSGPLVVYPDIEKWQRIEFDSIDKSYVR